MKADFQELARDGNQEKDRELGAHRYLPERFYQQCIQPFSVPLFAN